MSGSKSFDTIWEQTYASGHGQRYPWDSVVSFVFRNAPRDRPRGRVRILEVGCGAGGNVWFAAREGFDVAGVDASENAIETARRRLRAEGLHADLRVADFTCLPYDDGHFDLVIDRGALTCCGRVMIRRALDEIARVTLAGGRFLFTPYAESHSSFLAGARQPDGATMDISHGPLSGFGQLYFASRRDIVDWLDPCWNIRSLSRREDTNMTTPQFEVHAEWHVIADRKA